MIQKSKLIIAIVLLLTTACAAQAQPAADAVLAEVARCRAEVAKLPDSALQPADREALNSQLKVSEEAARAGHVPLALHSLSRVWRLTGAQALRVANEPQYKDGMPALERAWTEAGKQRQRKLARAVRASPSASTAAQALASAALHESNIVYGGAMVYGGQVGVMAGYFYLGEAQGLLDFALFCRKLPGSGKPAPYIGALGARIVNLENEVLEEFARDTASPQRDFFARANGSLKLARELNHSRELAGALYEYLLAQHAMGQYRATVAQQDRATIGKAALEMEKKITASKTDTGIAEIFLQLGQLELKSAETAADPKQNLINAQAFFVTVLPAYFKAVGE